LSGLNNMRRIIGTSRLILVLLLLCVLRIGLVAAPRQNFYYEDKTLIDIRDRIGDDKGSGYYQYPLNKELKRGTFDLKRFTVYEEGDLIVFDIQFRDYIMRNWNNGRSEQQGFVANLIDIYVDIDGVENSGYSFALPGRNVSFSGKMGWEKVIVVSPLSFIEMSEHIRTFTDDIDFMRKVPDIIVADGIIVEQDRIKVKVLASKIPGLSENSGFQCFSMGFSRVLSASRFFNADVRAFPTADDFGGGYDEYGEPSIIDMVTPEGVSQYELLSKCRTSSYLENIEYASVPFVYKDGKGISPVCEEKLKRAAARQTGGSLKGTPLPQSLQQYNTVKQQTRPVSKPVAVQPPQSSKTTQKSAVQSQPQVPDFSNFQRLAPQKQTSSASKSPVTIQHTSKTQEKATVEKKVSQQNQLMQNPPSLEGFVPLN